jgi:hypothetical protein
MTRQTEDLADLRASETAAAHRPTVRRMWVKPYRLDGGSTERFNLATVERFRVRRVGRAVGVALLAADTASDTVILAEGSPSEMGLLRDQLIDLLDGATDHNPLIDR